jgi:hypothetical protein
MTEDRRLRALSDLPISFVLINFGFEVISNILASCLTGWNTG